MVHKSLKCIHLACLRGCSIALRAECDKCYGAHHHHLILYVTEKKIWPGMVVSGRTRYLRYCLLISVMKPPLREETDHEPDFNHLFLLVPIFLLSQPESTDQKTLIPSLDGKQRKGIQNSLMPCHAMPDMQTVLLHRLHQLQMSSYTLVKQQPFTCVP